MSLTSFPKHESTSNFGLLKSNSFYKICSRQNFHIPYPLSASHWRHNDHDGVSNHQPHGCLLNRLFRRRSKKTSKLRVTGLRAVISPGLVNSRQKGAVTRKMFPFDDVIVSNRSIPFNLFLLVCFQTAISSANLGTILGLVGLLQYTKSARNRL